MATMAPLLQVANAALLVSYVSSNLLFLRICLFIATFLFMLSGFIIFQYSIDTIVWNGVFAIINLYQAGLIIYSMRPIKLDPRLEELYEKVFSVSFSRLEFKTLTENLGFVRELKEGSVYVDENNKPYHLSILLRGSMSVSKYSSVEKRDILLGQTCKMQFIDSVQYVSRKHSPNQVFEIKIKADTDCEYLCWPRENLSNLFENHPEGKRLEQMLDTLCGSDVAFKLLSVDEHAAATGDHGSDESKESLENLTKTELLEKFVDIQERYDALQARAEGAAIYHHNRHVTVPKISDIMIPDSTISSLPAVGAIESESSKAEMLIIK